MSYLIEWVTNIIMFILLATVIDMLLPSSSMQKYIKIVTGLLLIAIILTPVLKLISKDFESSFSSITSLKAPGEKNNIENLIEFKKKEIQASQRAYILEQMAVQLKKGVEGELMDQFGLEIAKIDILADEKTKQTFPDNLQRVSVLLKHPDKQIETVEAVKQITIDTETPLSTKQDSEPAKKIAAFLSQEWNVSEKAIQVSIEGGRTNKNG